MRIINLFTLLLIFWTSSCQNKLSPSNVLDENKDKSLNMSSKRSADFTSKPEVLEKLNKIFPLKSNDAIEIVRTNLKLSDEDAKYLVACDGGISWRVINTQKKQEVYVYKGGTYLGSTLLLNKTVAELSSASPVPITQQQAIDIGRRYFIEYGKKNFNSDETILDDYFPSVCDVGAGWRVLFLMNELENIKSIEDVKNLPNAHPPNFLIDKKTGEILYCNYP